METFQPPEVAVSKSIKSHLFSLNDPRIRDTMQLGINALSPESKDKEMLGRSTLTDRFQTTIPAVVRKALGLKPGQKITYEMQDQGVLIRPADSLMDLAGTLRSDVRPLGKHPEREAARKDRLQRNL